MHDEKRQTTRRVWGDAGVMRRATIALRGKQATIECENLIQVIFIAGVKESIILPQRRLLLSKHFLNMNFIALKTPLCNAEHGVRFSSDFS